MHEAPSTIYKQITTKLSRGLPFVRMQIFLKEAVGGLWLKPSGRWEANREGAVEFPNGCEAIAHAATFQAFEVDVVFHAENAEDSFALKTERCDVA
jgi:hypothetical protein